MTNKEIVAAQLSLDMQCSMEKINSNENIFILANELHETRAWNNVPLCLIIINGKFVVRATDKALLEDLKELIGKRDAAWFLNMKSMLKLEQILANYQMTTSSVGPYLIPSSRQSKVELPAHVRMVCYDEVALQQFKGDERFGEALGFNENYPDKIAVALFNGDDIIGMAGASADSQYLWQVGIDVIPEYRGQGFASLLVAQIAKEIAKEDSVVPFYGTAYSHIFSLNTAIKSGFSFGWMELKAENMEAKKSE